MGTRHKAQEINKKELYGLVLGGGKSTRMKQDKSLLNYHGKPQIQFGYDLLKFYCGRTFVSNRKDQASIAGHEGLPQIHDDENFGAIGPLAGILSAMKAFPGVAWLVLACDLPYLTPKVIEYLIAHRDPKFMATAFISSHDQLPEPLCAIYEPSSQPVILEFLRQGINCPRKIMIKSANVCLLQLEDKTALDNINNPDEYAQAKTILKHHDQRTKK